MSRQVQEREPSAEFRDARQAHENPAAPAIGRDRQHAAASIAAIKALHSLIFLGMAAAILHTLYSGLTNRISRLTAVSIASVVGEGLVLLVNNGRCPLTDVVEDLGSEHGSVSDIFLPAWFAERIPVLFTPPFAVGITAIGVRRRRERPVMATLLAVVGGLFLVMPWLLHMDRPRPRSKGGGDEHRAAASA